jgi:hypothetical protein
MLTDALPCRNLARLIVSTRADAIWMCTLAMGRPIRCVLLRVHPENTIAVTREMEDRKSIASVWKAHMSEHVADEKSGDSRLIR